MKKHVFWGTTLCTMPVYRLLLVSGEKRWGGLHLYSALVWRSVFQVVHGKWLMDGTAVINYVQNRKHYYCEQLSVGLAKSNKPSGVRPLGIISCFWSISWTKCHCTCSLYSMFVETRFNHFVVFLFYFIYDVIYLNVLVCVFVYFIWHVFVFYYWRPSVD